MCDNLSQCYSHYARHEICVWLQGLVLIINIQDGPHDIILPYKNSKIITHRLMAITQFWSLPSVCGNRSAIKTTHWCLSPQHRISHFALIFKGFRSIAGVTLLTAPSTPWLALILNPLHLLFDICSIADSAVDTVTLSGDWGWM